MTDGVRLNIGSLPNCGRRAGPDFEKPFTKLIIFNVTDFLHEIIDYSLCLTGIINGRPACRFVQMFSDY